MLLVGLTGGIASGKSLVARIFKDLGAHLIDADCIVRDLMAPDEPAWEEISAYFGADILLPDRSIDRRKLGAIVFRDAEKRSWLNQCLHPRVFDAYQARVRSLRERRSDCVVVFDAALLIETGYHRMMDRLVVVAAEPSQQLRRLRERDGLSETDATARIRSQIPLDEKRKVADFVIENSGDRAAAEQEAKRVLELLKREAERER